MLVVLEHGLKAIEAAILHVRGRGILLVQYFLCLWAYSKPRKKLF
jgi:hypothetical protein